MRIFGLEINKARSVENISKPRPSQADIYNNYVKQKTQIYRISKDVGDYKTAVIAAENWMNPQRYLLYQIYRNIEIDAHLTAVLQQRKNLTLSKTFKFVDKEGEETKVETNIFAQTWFREFLNHSLDSIAWGHSLIQFKDIKDNQITGVELIPRQFVKPELHIVAQTWTDITGNDYMESPWKEWCISVGESHDFGLYMKAAPLLIWKQAALGAWAEYQEVFGNPMRYLKTNVLDAATKASGIDMMENMGSSTWAVIDTNDELIISESSQSDAFQVFDQMINRVNSEISKLFLGQTGTTDEKSFVGSAEVQERTLEAYGKNDEHFILSVINDKLLPLLKNLGITFPEGSKVAVSEKEDLTTVEKSTIMLGLINSGKYKVKPDYIDDNFDIEVEEVEEPKETDTVSKIKSYYE